jgi:hypothetical protein
LKGKTREIAKAEYELEGYDLDMALANLKYEDKCQLHKEVTLIEYKHGRISEYVKNKMLIELEDSSEDEKNLRLLDLDLHEGKISQYDHDVKCLDHNGLEGDELELLRAKVEHDHKKITDSEYEKRVATIKKEPWVKVVNVGTEPKNPEYGSFELDWNEYFLEQLQDNGYVAPHPEDIIDMWLTNLCRNIAMSGAMTEEEMEYFRDRKVTKIKK